MHSLIDLFAENQLVLLFTIIGLGYLVGNIKIFGLKLGVAAVLFVGIAFGAIDKRLALPEYIYIIGLVLFVYAIGLQAGPGFFASFHKRGLRFSLVAGLILASGAAVAVILADADIMPTSPIYQRWCKVILDANHLTKENSHS